jgi:inositol-phosphate phosphatase/L-galactose 1-phosphate phosphatase/histidinol-phosphatase
MVALAQRMADAAGDIARRYFQKQLAVEQKADASPVTQADREIEAAIRKLIEAEYPEHGIIGEEFGNVRPDAAFQWVLDPIDGTRAFIAGQPTFTTLIALAKDGVPMLGVIDQPISRERWVGVTGQPTILNGKPATTSQCNALEKARVGTTSAPNYFKPAEAAAFEEVRKKCAQTIMGGDGYGYARLASGQMDLFIDASLKSYDFCALVPVVEGAGGIITDWAGKPLTTRSDGRVIAAASKALHAEALTFLQSAV